MRISGDYRVWRYNAIAFIGIRKGRAEGEAKSKFEIARSMKNKGLDIALIAECTGLSVEEIGGL